MKKKKGKGKKKSLNFASCIMRLPNVRKEGERVKKKKGGRANEALTPDAQKKKEKRREKKKKTPPGPYGLWIVQSLGGRLF